MPSSANFKAFFTLFGVQCLQYALVTMNMRAIAAGNYPWTIGTDLIFATANFFVIKKVAQAESGGALVGYVLGGTTGSVVALWVTKQLMGG